MILVKQIFKGLLNFVKMYPFLSILILMSCTISIIGIPLGYGLVSLFPTIILIIASCFLHRKTAKDNDNLGCGYFIIFSLPIIFQLIVSVCMYFDISKMKEEAKYNNPQKYEKIMSDWKNEDVKKIFPKTLPQTVEDYKFENHSGGFIDFRGTLDLSFIADSDYIANERKRLNLIPSLRYVKEDETKVDYSIINNYEYPDDNYENRYYGYCIIDKNTNKINYYYKMELGDACLGCYKETRALLNCKSGENCVVDMDVLLKKMASSIKSK